MNPLRKHWQLYAMLIPSVILLLVFHFYPMWGISLAFMDYNKFRGVSGSEWVGLDIFKEVFSDSQTWRLVRNTLFMAIGQIVFGQLAALAFALMLYEIASRKFRRVVQTIATVPHFLSWVIAGGVLIQMLASTGYINDILASIGLGKVEFLSSTAIFPWTVIFADVWKGFGFASVIYLAALMNVNPELYEAAAVDQAGRGARLRHITLPSIAPIIILLACLSLGSVLNAGMEEILVLYNPLVYETGDIIDTWVYRAGILDSQYSLATAVGLFKALVGFILIMVSYWAAGKFANYRIF